LDTLAWRTQPLSPSVWGAFHGSIAALRERHYDCALDLQGALKSAAACTLSGAREVIGFSAKPWLREPACAVFYTRRVKTDAVHIVEANIALAASLGAQRTVIRFPLPAGDPAALPAAVWEEGIAMLNPGAGWKSKRWPAAGYAFLSDRLSRDYGLQVVLNSGPGEETLAREVQEACRQSRPLVYSGAIPGLIALLRRARLAVGPDTGPLHLAAALGVPTVALYGPTDPRRNGPYGARHKALRPEDARTSHRHSATDHGAMSRIPAEQVAEAVRELLAGERESVRRER
jgi:heptosyltransferase-1